MLNFSTLPQPDSTRTIYNIAASPSGALVISMYGKIMYSTNKGQTWVNVPVTNANVQYWDCIYSPTLDLFSVCAMGGRFYWVAGDLATQGQGTATGDMYGQAEIAGRLVSVGTLGRVNTSDDGKSWTYRGQPVSTSDLYQACRHGIYVYACGASGKLIRSMDGETWEAVPHNLRVDRSYWGITSLGDRLVIVGNSGLMAYSDDDGSTWTERASVVGAVLLYNVTAHGDTLMAATTNGRVVVSFDRGDSWSVYQTSVGSTLYATEFVDGDWIAVGLSGDATISPHPFLYQVQGTVTDSQGAPAQRTVRIYRRSDGALLREVVSDPITGIYTADLYGEGEIQPVVLADDAAERAKIIAAGGTVTGDELWPDFVARVLPGVPSE